MLAFSILATLLCDAIATSSHYNLTQELRSRDAIKGQVPPGGGMAPVVVDVALIPMNILDIDDAKQVVSLSTSLILMWTHPGLAWDPSPEGPYAKLHVLELKTQELWIPKVHILNGASEDRTLDMGSTAIVFSNGSVLVSVLPLMKFTCKMDMRVYPFDTQECGLVVFITSTYRAQGRKKKDFIMSSESLIGSFGSNGEWTLENVESEEKEMLAGVSFLVYTLKLRRKTTFYVISFIVPIVLTSYMNTLVFVIPAESGERVSYLVSIFVSNAVFVSFCTDQMPQGLDSVPLVMMLQLGTMAQSAFFIFLVGYLQRRSYRHQNHDITDDVTSSPSVSKDASEAKVAWPKNAVRPLDDEDAGKQKSPRVSGKEKDAQLDFILFLVSVVITSVFVVTILATMMQ